MKGGQRFIGFNPMELDDVPDSLRTPYLREGNVGDPRARLMTAPGTPKTGKRDLSGPDVGTTDFDVGEKTQALWFHRARERAQRGVMFQLRIEYHSGRAFVHPKARSKPPAMPTRSR